MRERERERGGNNAIRATTTIVSPPYFTSFAFFLSLSFYMYTYMFIIRRRRHRKKKMSCLHICKTNKRALCVNVTVKKAITVCFGGRERERTASSFCLYMYTYVQSCDSYITALLVTSEQIDFFFLLSFSIYIYTYI